MWFSKQLRWQFKQLQSDAWLAHNPGSVAAAGDADRVVVVALFWPRELPEDHHGPNSTSLLGDDMSCFLMAVGRSQLDQRQRCKLASNA